MEGGLTAFCGWIDVECLILDPGRDRKEVSDETGHPADEHCGVPGQNLGVIHFGLILLHHNCKHTNKTYNT